MSKRFLSELKDRTVVGADGRIIGILVDLDIDETNMMLGGIILRVESSVAEELGLSKPFWRSAHVLIPATHVAAVTDVVLLSASTEQIAEQIRQATPEPEESAPAVAAA